MTSQAPPRVAAATCVLRASRWCYRVSWRCPDRVRFTALIDDWKHTVLPYVDGAEFLPDEKAWHLPAGGERYLLPFLRRWFGPGVTPDRTADPDHAATYHGQAVGREDSSSMLLDAYQALHLQPTAPPDLIPVVYRALAKLAHPDAGGCHGDMVGLNRAYERLSTALVMPVGGEAP